MSVRLVRSGRWNPPVGICGQGACPLPDDAEEVEDLLTDILLKLAMDPGSDPGDGGSDRSGGPLPLSLELWLVPLDSLLEQVLVWWH